MKNLIAIAVIAAFSGMAFAADPVAQPAQPAGIGSPTDTKATAPADVKKETKKKKKKKKAQ